MACSNFPLSIAEVGAQDDMATATELTILLATLNEKVANHIKFFWVVVSFGFVWLAALSALDVHINKNVDGIATAQANAPAQIATAILSKPVSSPVEVQTSLSAVSTILNSAKKGSKAPAASELQPISVKLSRFQEDYPNLLQVWQTTGEFIKLQVRCSSSRKWLAPGKCRIDRLQGVGRRHDRGQRRNNL